MYHYPVRFPGLSLHIHSLSRKLWSESSSGNNQLLQDDGMNSLALGNNWNSAGETESEDSGLFILAGTALIGPTQMRLAFGIRVKRRIRLSTHTTLQSGANLTKHVHSKKLYLRCTQSISSTNVLRCGSRQLTQFKTERFVNAANPHSEVDVVQLFHRHWLSVTLAPPRAKSRAANGTLCHPQIRPTARDQGD